MLTRILGYLEKVIPDTWLHASVAALGSLLPLIFPAPAAFYKAFAVLIAIDTATGMAAAVKEGRFNSRSWRVKLFSKITSYMLVPTALYTFAVFLADTPLQTMFDLGARLTVASIAFIELTSILENVGALLGRRVTLRFKVDDLKDLMESNHVNNDNGDGSVQQVSK